MQRYSKPPADAAGMFTIWPGQGVPPGSEDWTWHEQASQPAGSSIPDEMARNVVVPTLTMFKPEANTSRGTAIIVAPGGAFHFLMMYHEGYDVARWLAKLGVTAFVLKYRVQHTPENEADWPAFHKELNKRLASDTQRDTDPPVRFAALEQARLWGEEDGRQAIRYLRQHAAELDIDPQRIGIMGFSAGGGVAVGAALQHDALSRPDFVGPMYPGYRMITPIPEDVPPLFIAIADDDPLVGPISSTRLYEAWHKRGQTAELHILCQGGHGFGMRRQSASSGRWSELFQHWLAIQGYISLA